MKLSKDVAVVLITSLEQAGLTDETAKTMTSTAPRFVKLAETGKDRESEEIGEHWEREGRYQLHPK